jgi:hypothetical protein
MATSRQARAARRNVKKAQQAGAAKKTIAHLPAKTRTALGKQGAAVARRKRTGSASPKLARSCMRSPGNAICRAGQEWAAMNSPGSWAKSSG